MTRRLAAVLAVTASVAALVAVENARMWKRIHAALAQPCEVPDYVPEAWFIRH